MASQSHPEGRAAHQVSLTVWWTADQVHAALRAMPRGDYSRSQSAQVVSVDFETAGVDPRVIVRRCLSLAIEALDELPVSELGS